MKKILFTAFLVYITFSMFPDETPYKYYSTYDYLKEFYFPCDEGTENEKKLIEYIKQFCITHNLSHKIVKINNSKDIITNSYNIEVHINGTGGKRETQIIVCPLNSSIIKQQSYDNSLSIIIMLELLKRCKNTPFKKDLIFLFSGANHREDYNYQGIRHFIDTQDNLNRSFVTIIDILSTGTDIRFSGSTKNKPIPSKILLTFLKLNQDKNTIYFDKLEILRSRFRINLPKNHMSLFLDKNVHAVSFSNKENSIAPISIFNHELQENLIDFYYQWLMNVDKIDFPFDTDYNYHYITLFDKKIIISEYLQIGIFLILVFLMILIKVLFPALQRFHITLFFKVLPYYIIIFLVFYLSTFIPLLFFLIIGNVKNFPVNYFNTSILYYFNLFIIPTLMVLTVFEILRRLPFPRYNYLYLFGATVFSLINLIAFSIINISLTYIFLWIIIILTISQFTRRAFLLKYFCYALTPLPLILTISDFFKNDIRLLQYVNPYIGNFLAAVVSFPFILLIIRIHLINRNKFKIYIRKRVYIIMILITLFFSFIILLLISKARIPIEENLYSRTISNISHNSSSLHLKSQSKIGKITITENENLYTLNINKKNFTHPIHYIEPPYQIDLKTEHTGNLEIDLQITSDIMPEFIRLYLISPENSFPIDSNYRYQQITDFKNEYIDKKQNVYKFHTGRNPGKKLRLTAICPPGLHKIYIEIEYPFIDDTIIDIERSRTFIYKQSVFIENFELK